MYRTIYAGQNVQDKIHQTKYTGQNITGHKLSLIRDNIPDNKKSDKIYLNKTYRTMNTIQNVLDKICYQVESYQNLDLNTLIKFDFAIFGFRGSRTISAGCTKIHAVAFLGSGVLILWKITMKAV